MEFFASLWWVWLAGLLCTGGVALYFWVRGILSTGSDVIAIAQRVVTTAKKSHEHISNKETNASRKATDVAGEVAVQATEVVVERATDKAKKFGISTALSVAAVVSGILFLLSLAFNLYLWIT